MIRRALLAIGFLAFLAPAIAQAPPPVPALPDTQRLTTYTITSSTCACAVGFQIYGDNNDYGNWIEVWLNGVLQPSSSYTVTSPTGPLASIPRPITDAVLTFNSPQTGTVQIVGARRPRRTAQFPEGRGVAARDLNQAFTDIVAQNRETWDRTNDVTGRALLTQPGNAMALLPTPAQCANSYLIFDSTGLTPKCTSGAGNALPGVPTITRAQISSNVISTTTFAVVGYRTANDLGYGAVYSSVGASCPNGLMAIKDAAGTCFNLLLNNLVNVGWFGAAADDGATTISAGDIAANPQWRGTYVAGTTWDTVAVQESKYAAYASASTPGNIVWNGSTSKLNVEWFLPNGTYGINKQILSVQSGFRDRGEGKGTAVLDWQGTAGTIMWLCDSCDYGQEINLTISDSTTPSYPNLAPLVSWDHTGAIPGLETQQLTLYDMACFAGINSECFQISRSGSGAQGDTITFVNPIFAGFMSDYAINLNGANALEVIILNGDCQGFPHDCLQSNGGNFVTYGTHFENQNNQFSSSTPIMTQLTTRGADLDMTGGVSTERNVMHDARAEDEVLTASAFGAGSVDVHNSLTASVDTGFGFFASFPYLQGYATFGTANNTKGRTFMVVDDGGNGKWANPTSSSGLVLTDNAASYTVNQWVGFDLHWRFGSNGFTFHCPITANTATTITVQTGCNGGALPAVVASTMYHIGGFSGASQPNWDSASGGHHEFAGTNQGLYTQAGSNQIAIGSVEFGRINVGDYVVIVNGDQIAPTGVQAIAMPFYAKVTAKSNSPCAFGGAVPTCITVNKNATLTAGSVTFGLSALAWYGTPISDGNLSWIEIPYSIVQGGFVISDLQGNGQISPNARTTVVNFQNSRPDWFDTTSFSGGGANAAAAVANMFSGTLSAALCQPLANGATINLALWLPSCSALPYTPTQSATLNAPAPPPGAAQQFDLLITTSGTTSYTITFGSNFTANGVLNTGTVSGAVWTVRFISDGTTWREAWRSPGSGLAANVSPTTGFSAGQILYSDGAKLQAGNALAFPSSSIWEFGGADIASPAAQTLEAQSVAAGTANTAGANLSILGSKGTGNAAGGNILFKVGAAGGSSGTAQNAAQEIMRVSPGNVGSSGWLGFLSSTIFAGSGIFLPSASELRFYENGLPVLDVNGATLGINLGPGSLQFGTAVQASGMDVFAFRDAAAGALAVADSTTASGLRVYNTTDQNATGTAPTNYERAVFDWLTTANTLTIGTQKGGAGTNRGVTITAANSLVTFDTGNNTGVTAAGFDIWHQTNGYIARGDVGDYGFATATIGSSINTAIYKAADNVVAISNSSSSHTVSGWLQWAGEARVSSDFSATSNTTLANVTGLSVTLLGSRKYSFHIPLFFSTGATAGGIKVALGGTATVTNLIADAECVDGTTNVAGTQVSTLGSNLVANTNAGTTPKCVIEGTFESNAGGTFTVQFAQNASSATPSAVKRGSYMLVQDMP